MLYSVLDLTKVLWFDLTCTVVTTACVSAGTEHKTTDGDCDRTVRAIYLNVAPVFFREMEEVSAAP